MRIKHAYNTLMNPEAKFKYNQDERNSKYSRKGAAQDEDFYGFGMISYSLHMPCRDLNAVPTKFHPSKKT